MSRAPRERRGRPRGIHRPRVAATVPASLHARLKRLHRDARRRAGARVSFSAIVETVLTAGLDALEGEKTNEDVGGRD